MVSPIPGRVCSTTNLWLAVPLFLWGGVVVCWVLLVLCGECWAVGWWVLSGGVTRGGGTCKGCAGTAACPSMWGCIMSSACVERLEVCH